MLRYVLQRVGLMIITAFIITTIVFIMIKLMPNYNKPQLGVDPAQWEIIQEREGYNKPIPEQYAKWLRNVIIDGNLGYSRTYDKGTTEIMIERIPVSVKINIFPFLISIPIGFSLGIWAALRKNKFDDHFISFGVIFFISVPSFVVATLLQYYFGYVWTAWDLQPLYAAKIDIAADPSLLWKSMVLPVAAMTSGSIAGLTRYTRAELTEVLTSEFMLLCRTKGLSRRQSTVRHALRNSMVPLAPMIIGGLVSILSGSLIIEKTFRIQGIGKIYLEAFQARDYDLVMTLLLFYMIIGLSTTLIVDLSYSIVDPRIRLGGGKK